MDVDLYNDTYDRFCELLEKKNPAVFEIGCGPGNITRYLLMKRPDLRIDAIDMSPNMIALAQKNNPAAQFRVMDGRDIGTLTKKYDAIMCGFCMPYLSKEDNANLFRHCSERLYADGIFYISTIKGDYENSGYETASTGDKCYVYYYDEANVLALLEENHFQLVERMYKEFARADGSVSSDMIFIARKMQSDIP